MSIKVPFFDWAGYYRERAGEFARIMDETAGRGGFILQRDIGFFRYSHVGLIIAATFAVVLVIDTASGWLRRKLV